VSKYNRNHRKPWTLDHLRELRLSVKLGIPWRVIALKLARSERAVKTAWINYEVYKRRCRERNA
jgi:hypothetical protein